MATRVTLLERLADRFIGPPLLVFARVMRRKGRRWFRTRLERVDFERIALLRTACIGDTILASAIIADLRAAFPYAKITLVVGPDNAGTSPLLDVDRVKALPLQRPFAALGAMRRLDADLLIDLGAWPRIDALLTASCRTATTVGFQTPKQHRHYAYDISVRHRDDCHELDNLRSLLEALNVPAAHEPGLTVPAGQTLELPERTVILHPFSAGRRAYDKHWPTARWVAVARELQSRGFTIAVTGSPADREGANRLARAIDTSRRYAQASPAPGVEGTFNLAGVTDLPTLARTLKQPNVKAIISVNTGIAHLAATVGTPTLSLDGSVRTDRWGPRGDNVTSIPPSPPELAYIHLGSERRPRGNEHPMLTISVETVLQAFEQITGQASPAPAPAATPEPEEAAEVEQS